MTVSFLVQIRKFVQDDGVNDAKRILVVLLEVDLVADEKFVDYIVEVLYTALVEWALETFDHKFVDYRQDAFDKGGFYVLFGLAAGIQHSSLFGSRWTCLFGLGLHTGGRLKGLLTFR